MEGAMRVAYLILVTLVTLFGTPVRAELLDMDCKGGNYWRILEDHEIAELGLTTQARDFSTAVGWPIKNPTTITQFSDFKNMVVVISCPLQGFNIRAIKLPGPSNGYHALYVSRGFLQEHGPAMLLYAAHEAGCLVGVGRAKDTGKLADYATDLNMARCLMRRAIHSNDSHYIEWMKMTLPPEAHEVAEEEGEGPLVRDEPMIPLLQGIFE